MADELPQLLPSVLDIVKLAGKAIMPYHRTKVAQKQFTLKDDRSPVTLADLAANQVIVAGLKELAPWPVLSEESEIADFATRQGWARYWLVDPLDGTKDFIAGSNDFTVNIALIDNHQPVLGVILTPTDEVAYSAYVGGKAVKHMPNGAPETMQVSSWDGERNLKIVTSRRHDNKHMNHLTISDTYCDIERIGSSIKFCRVAQGVADFYPRFGPTSEWDTAAGQCIVEQAGGSVTDRDGARLLYNTKDSLLNPHFIVVGDYDNIQRLWRK